MKKNIECPSGKKHIGETIALALLILLAVLFLWIVFESKPDRKGEEGPKSEVLSEKVDLQVKDFHYTEVGDPRFVWEINADTAKYMKKKNITLFENVRAKLVSSDGRTYFMKGEKGRWHTDSKDIDVYGNVTVTSDKGECLKTDSVSYIFSEKRILARKDVTMISSNLSIKGRGMDISLEDGKLTILSNVSARIDSAYFNW